MRNMVTDMFSDICWGLYYEVISQFMHSNSPENDFDIFAWRVTPVRNYITRLIMFHLFGISLSLFYCISSIFQFNIWQTCNPFSHPIALSSNVKVSEMACIEPIPNWHTTMCVFIGFIKPGFSKFVLQNEQHYGAETIWTSNQGQYTLYLILNELFEKMTHLKHVAAILMP